MVMRRPKQVVQVMGLVKRPGQFEIPADQELLGDRLHDGLLTWVSRDGHPGKRSSPRRACRLSM